jgi:hypothetical protein
MLTIKGFLWIHAAIKTHVAHIFCVYWYNKQINSHVFHFFFAIILLHGQPQVRILNYKSILEEIKSGA